MSLNWDPSAWADYQYWARTDTRIRDRINALIQDIQNQGTLGKPIPLGNPAGYEVRRITLDERLVYRVDGGDVLIAACRYHYGAERASDCCR